MQRNYLDRIGDSAWIDETITLLERNPWCEHVDWDYPGVFSISMTDGSIWMFGQANETWGGDYYPNGAALEHGDPATGMASDLSSDIQDSAKVEQAITAEIERFVERKAFIAKLAAFRKAAFALTMQWEQLHEDDATRLAHKYPFAQSFDELCSEIGAWEESVQAGFAIEPD